MDLSAARPVQQRYTAGGCALDVTLQPSALTQWYPRTVAQTLTFKLWLAVSPETESPDPTSQMLVAEGDRDTLQAITRYVAQQTHNALMVAHSDGLDPLPLAPCPSDLHVQLPLSYLQLCDLTAVFNQVEQATQLLPVPLGSNDAISSPRSSLRSSSRGRLIIFPARKLWASSAAAALLAIGLTTALWPRDSQRDAAIISDAAREPAPAAESAPRQNAATQSEDAPAVEPGPAPSESVAVDPPNATPAPPADHPLNVTPAPSATVRPTPPAATLPEDLAITAEEAQPSEPPASATADVQPQREAQLETQVARRATPEVLSESAQSEDDQTSPATAADAQTAETDILTQVQQYFQAQWQASPQAVQLPLVYELQLSRSGEVMRFTGIGEAAQSYSDRILPTAPPTFALNAEEALTLRVAITAEGIVQVSRR